MAKPTKGPDPAEESPRGDPWHAFGYLVSGVALYGLLGWGLDRLLDTTGFVAVGILVGAALGLYLTWVRFMSPRPAPPQSPTSTTSTTPTDPTETRQEAR